MSKQEQIEEMANNITKHCPDKVEEECFNKDMNCISCIVNELYDAGYRKEDDVRKETAKEILNAVDDESNGQTISVTNVLRKKYGVEVEE